MDDASLLQATATGDADAFAVFYRRHLPLVVSFAARMTRDREAAADLAGEVFAAALAGCGRYRPTHVSVAPWLIGIAQNKLRESQRRGRAQDAVRRRLQMRPIELGEDDLERVEALASASYSDVLAAVDALPQDERDAVRPGLWMSATTGNWPSVCVARSRSCASESAAGCAGSARRSANQRRKARDEAGLLREARG